MEGTSTTHTRGVPYLPPMWSSMINRSTVPLPKCASNSAKGRSVYILDSRYTRCAGPAVWQDSSCKSPRCMCCLSGNSQLLSHYPGTYTTQGDGLGVVSYVGEFSSLLILPWLKLIDGMFRCIEPRAMIVFIVRWRAVCWNCPLSLIATSTSSWLKD